jgi:hypothetical protein
MPQETTDLEADHSSLPMPSDQLPISPISRSPDSSPDVANPPPTPLDGGASSSTMAIARGKKSAVLKASDIPMRKFNRRFLTSAQLAAQPRRVAVPRANCTHITMDVLHGPGMTCDFCGRASVLGWLYQCQQDKLSSAQAREELRYITHDLPVNEMSPIKELEAIGMSDSIIDQFKKGNVYEPWQVELLKAQKLHLQKAIEKQLEKEREPWNTHTTSDSADERTRRNSQNSNISIHPNITMRVSTRQASLSLVHKMDKFRLRSASMARCTLKCCQACRPYFKDRAFMSFDLAFANEVDLLDTIEGLPVADAAIVRQIGLRRPLLRRPLFNRGSNSQDTSSSELTNSSSSGLGESDLEFDLNPSEEVAAVPTASTSVVEDAHLGSTANESPPTPYVMRSQTLPPGVFMSNISGPVKSVLDQDRVLSPSYSDPALCIDARSPRNNHKSIPSTTPTRGGSQFHGSILDSVDNSAFRPTDSQSDLASNDGDFDLGLQGLTLISHGSIDLVAAAENHNGITINEWCDPIRRTSAASSAYSDEIAVDGGVALTEEAVETQTPDIITHT